MKLSRCFFGAALMMLLTLSCSKETEADPAADLEPGLAVSQDVTAAAYGGRYTCTYSIVNPADGGTVECIGNRSWISDVADDNGSVSFSVASNTVEEPRSGGIEITYSYSGGHVTRTVEVVQDPFEAPVFNVESDDVSVRYFGGFVTLEYSVDNPVEGAELVCTADADWVNSFDCSVYGVVDFNIEENTLGEPRECVLTLTYSHYAGTVSASVNITQGFKADISVSDLVGSYSCNGMVYNENYDWTSATEPGVTKTWRMKIYEDETTENGLILNGLVPDIVSYYPTVTSEYIARGTLTDEGAVTIYPQPTGGGFTYNGIQLYTWWILCTDFVPNSAATSTKGAGWYHSNGMEDCCTFTYDSDAGVWTCDYGMFLCYNLDGEVFSSDTLVMFDDVFAPGMYFYKTSDLTSTQGTTSPENPGTPAPRRNLSKDLLRK